VVDPDRVIEALFFGVLSPLSFPSALSLSLALVYVAVLLVFASDKKLSLLPRKDEKRKVNAH
jgi:hypothetical protein